MDETFRTLNIILISSRLQTAKFNNLSSNLNFSRFQAAIVRSVAVCLVVQPSVFSVGVCVFVRIHRFLAIWFSPIFGAMNGYTKVYRTLIQVQSAFVNRHQFSYIALLNRNRLIPNTVPTSLRSGTFVRLFENFHTFFLSHFDKLNKFE